MIELQDFITQTLVQLVAGVRGAQEQIADGARVVNPPLNMDLAHLAKAGLQHSSVGGTTQLVSFDIAVEAKQGTGTKGGMGVAIGVLALGTSGQSNEESSHVSRIKFIVPVALPTIGQQ